MGRLLTRVSSIWPNKSFQLDLELQRHFKLYFFSVL